MVDTSGLGVTRSSDVFVDFVGSTVLVCVICSVTGGSVVLAVSRIVFVFGPSVYMTVCPIVSTGT